MASKLTAKQDAFVKEYLLNGGNATQAAIKAGYSEKTANEQGAQNLAKPAIKSALNKVKAEIEERLYDGVLLEVEELRGEVRRLKSIIGDGGGLRTPKSNNRYAVMYRAGFKCQCCGAKPSKSNDVVLHVDHITPFSCGGSNEPDNLQVLCASCNIAKSNFYDFDHNGGWDE